jgi:hypothetical protein
MGGTMVASMSTARRGGSRQSLVLGALALSLSAGTARAGGQTQLTLPLVAALSLGGSAAQLARAVTPPGGRKTLFGLLPKRLAIPDGYAVDPSRDPSPFAAGIMREHLVGVDLVGSGGPGFKAALSYDEESRGPLHGADDLMRLVVEYRF